ncbi:hypothetical protein BGZ60DRAFT_419371 [Tricladium varicosporioides]|nr:hypothetical protein BGZ60DRAFT_419371 [Hymenoscyphus varicosporioides]
MGDHIHKEAPPPYLEEDFARYPAPIRQNDSRNAPIHRKPVPRASMPSLSEASRQRNDLHRRKQQRKQFLDTLNDLEMEEQLFKQFDTVETKAKTTTRSRALPTEITIEQNTSSMVIDSESNMRPPTSKFLGFEVKQIEQHEISDQPPLPPARSELSMRTSSAAPVPNNTILLGPETAIPSLRRFNLAPPATRPSTAPSFSNPESPLPVITKASATSKMQQAFRDIRHAAGGLVHHPSESTKHFSILRHSHGVVFYKGTNTSVALTIFSDAPMPEDRTFWLQQKGWSGKKGMKVKAFFGRNSDWLNVTPTMNISPELLKPDDERAWQRDIGHFQKRSSKKLRGRHQTRETAVIRIPAGPVDGYYALVLCLGEKKKVLCTSPTFRLVSISDNLGCLKGASIGTVGFEVGLYAGSLYAKAGIAKIVAPAMSLASSKVTKLISKVPAKHAAKKAAVMKAYDASGLDKMVKSIITDGNDLYEQQRAGSSQAFGSVDISLEDGPTAPYPQHVTAYSLTSQGLEAEKSVFPIVDLNRVPSHVAKQFSGYYFGWCRFTDPNSKECSEDGDWVEQVVISALLPVASQLKSADFSEANTRVFRLSIASEMDESAFANKQCDVWILGQLRPDGPDERLQRAQVAKGIEEGDSEAEKVAMLVEINDVACTQQILDEPAWSLEAVLEKQRLESSGGLKGSYAKVRMAAQQQLDKVDLSKLGVRTEADKTRDKCVEMKGFYITR